MDGKKSQTCTTDITIYRPQKYNGMTTKGDDFPLGKMFTANNGIPFAAPPPIGETVYRHIFSGKYLDAKFYFIKKDGKSILELATIGINERK